MHKVMAVSREEAGNVLVLTALVLVGVLGFMALGIDLGLVAMNKRQLANAADAAALAGAQELPNAWSARERAYEYGQRNHLLSAEMAVDVSVVSGEVGVTAQRTVGLFFAPIIGVNTATVKASAKARVGPVKGLGGVVPLSIVEGNFQYGERYYLKQGPQPSSPEETWLGPYRGNFGPLALGGTGGNVYRENLKRGYKHILRVGDVVYTETGNMSGPTADGISWRLSQPGAGQCTFINANSACPQYVLVPIISGYTESGRQPVTIVGFAAFFLEGTTHNGNESYVIGRFIRRTVDGEVGGSADYGLSAYRLVE